MPANLTRTQLALIVTIVLATITFNAWLRVKALGRAEQRRVMLLEAGIIDDGGVDPR